MWRLAWRNLWRNRTRTGITGSAIALSLALQLFSYGTADSSYDKMLQSAVKTAGGSVLVHAQGYWESLETDKVIRDAAPIAAKLRTVEGVKAVIPRVIVTGLVSSARGSAGTRLIGIDKAAEAQINDLTKYVKIGTFLADGDDVKGPLVLGKSVVEDLKLKLNDRVVVTATDPAGETVRMAFRLTGILDTGSKMTDAMAAYTTIETLRRELRLPGGVTQFGLTIDDDELRGQIRARVVAALGPAAANLEALTWDEALPDLLGFIEVDKKFAGIFGILIFIVVAFGITNTFLMAVIERVRELGLLSALGMTPARIAQLVIIESFALAAVATGIGLALGLSIHFWVASHGIDFSALYGGDMEISGVVLDDMLIYSKIDPVRWTVTCALLLVLIVLAAWYPAWKATRMDPATAMRTYE